MTMLTPPENDAPLVLVAPEPVQEVKPEQAGGMVPAPNAQEMQNIKLQSSAFVKDIVKLNPHSPEFTAKVADIQNLAQHEIVQSGQASSRILDRKTSSVAGAKKQGGDATVRVANTLADLRATVEDLTPNAADLNGVHKILGFIPGGKKIRRYFQKYESAQGQLDGIVKSLLAGQDELMKDNAALNQEKQELWKVMGELNQYIILGEQLDADLVTEINRLKSAGQNEEARVLETDMLFTVRQRRQDLATQLAVSVQSYLAMDIVRKNNLELIKGVDRTRTTTISALRTAVIVAQALDNQKLVLDQIDALNATTNAMIENTSVMLREQTGRVHQQAVNSGVAVETLQKAFDNIFATMDEIENFKVQANATMEQTLTGLNTQLERAKPQLDRARQLEAQENQQRTAIGR